MKITKRQLRHLVREYRAHARRGEARGSDFPTLVRHSDRSEIAYNEDDLDSILDFLGDKTPYSLDSLEDIEIEDVPVGAEIETFAEGKMKITKRQLQGVINEAMQDDAQIMNPEYLRDTARDKIEEIINNFYDDLVEDGGLTPEDAQMQVQEMIDTLALHSTQGFIGMPT